MKIDCGETWADKKARLSEWHPFFTLWPRMLASHDCRWLEWIERKGDYFSCPLTGGGWLWQYRAKS